MGSRLLELRSAYSHSIPATTSESITLKGKDEDDEEEDEAPLYSQSAQVVGLKNFTSAQPVIPVTQPPVIVGQ